MRVLQLIDSLQPGGAERMALNLTNSLSSQIEYSGICVTREEGSLTDQIKIQAGYLFLGKRSSLDIGAFYRLYTFIKKNKINILHAHGTSFFTGSLIKIFTPHLKLVWHDHYGERIYKDKFAYPILYFSSFIFDGIFTVNKELLKWARKNLKTKETVCVPNFLVAKFTESFNQKKYGYIRDRNNIICIANLKKPKNHINLLIAFKIINAKFPEVKLLLVGKKFNDDYQKKIENFILKNNLQRNVVLTGEEPDVKVYLMESSIGVISSDSEGLPVALLEYGAAKLAVVSTKVGACQEVIGAGGQLVEIDNSKALSNSILFYLEDEEARIKDSKNFNNKVLSTYSEQFVLPEIIEFYKKINSRN